MTNNHVANLSINLSAIPKTAIKKASNGKLYVKLDVFKRKQVDQFGNHLGIGITGIENCFAGHGKIICFNGATVDDYCQNFEITLCITDYPKGKITRTEKDNLFMYVGAGLRKDKDKYGNDITLKVFKNKEERKANVPDLYCGNGRLIVPKYQAPADTDLDFLDASKYQVTAFSAAPAEDDLPF